MRRCTEIYLSKEEKEQEEEMSFRIAKTVKRWEHSLKFCTLLQYHYKRFVAIIFRWSTKKSQNLLWQWAPGKVMRNKVLVVWSSCHLFYEWLHDHLSKKVSVHSLLRFCLIYWLPFHSSRHAHAFKQLNCQFYSKNTLSATGEDGWIN